MSKVVTDSIYSENLKAWRAYTIYLPKSYEAQPDRKYPILYLLHGVIGTNLGWFHDQRANEVADQLMDSGEACEMIIVSPNAGGNPPTKYQNGYFNMPGWPYEDFFYQEFMPYIEKTYRVIGDKQHRAIAGLSMGGGGTASYAQRHPDLFCAAYAMSALMDLPAVGGIPAANPDDMMGKLNRSGYKETNLYLRGLIPLIGLDSTTVPDVISERRAGHSKYTLAKMLSLALDGITSFSVKPIYCILWLGLAFILVSLGIAVYVVHAIMAGTAVPGWSSLILSVWFVGGVVQLHRGGQRLFHR